MLDRLPIYIQPVSFSERGKTMSGVIEINALTRLYSLLQDTNGVVKVDISFEKEGRTPTVNGNVSANLKLECQMCLEQVVLSIDKSFKLGFVMSLEQADKLSSDCDPFIMEEEQISLFELIEDEVLLALPGIPKHDYDCTKREKNATTINDEQEIRSNNPFSVLAKLKNTGD